MLAATAIRIDFVACAALNGRVVLFARAAGNANGRVLRVSKMPHSSFQRRVVWLVLAMYMAAGVTAQLAHGHHGAVGHDADRVAVASPGPEHGITVSPAASQDDDDCAACGFLRQLSHGFVLLRTLQSATLEVPLVSLTPARLLSGLLIVPHSRGPPQLV
jgi:hypothetical protein